MNPRIDLLQPYPFERLRALTAGVTPPAQRPIRLTLGEPQHPTPALIRDALVAHLDGLATYPLTAGTERLREAIAAWFRKRYGLTSLDASTQVLPVCGSREALFSFAQTIVGPAEAGPHVHAGPHDPLIACPNPFYQIYEGAALLAGAQPVFLNQTAAHGFALDLDALSPAEWERVQLLFACSPGNPTGHVLSLEDWRALFDYADRYGFVIASDECYSEIYFDEGAAPLGGLEAAQALGRAGYERLVVFTSLSKRSNVPGMRSGAVAGDASLLAPFLRYRTYHGSAMSPAVQAASVAAWEDEAHVRENRALYREKFDRIVPLLASVIDAPRPHAGFYLWAHVPDAWGDDDERFASELLEATNVSVLPGRYLARDAHGVNPGAGRVRIALVASVDECLEAAERIVRYAHTHP